MLSSGDIASVLPRLHLERTAGSVVDTMTSTEVAAEVVQADSVEDDLAVEDGE